MQKTRIYSENTEQDLWRMLLQYSYKSNIKNYFEKRGFTNILETQKEELFEEISNSISGSLLQAEEYYKASKESSLHIAPLLLYYGTSNLLNAMSILLLGEKTEIENHGMKIVAQKTGNIAGTKIKFLNNSTGGVHVFARVMGLEKNLCDYYTNEDKTWKLFDFLDSISEICDDYNRCYNDKVSKIIMLNVLNTPEGKVEKIQTVVEKDVDINLSDIENFDKAYLPPIGGKTGNEFTHVVLRSKINGIDIRKISYSGQPYIQVAHIANGKKITIPEEINMYICLYALGNLCRYHPDVWYPFIMKDSTGEKLLMEKMLFYSRRMIPNFVLNRITNQDITFVSDKYSPEDRTHLVSDHEVKELIQKEVNHRINELKYSGIIH